MTCATCRQPLSPREQAAYRSVCEDCFSNNAGHGTREPVGRVPRVVQLAEFSRLMGMVPKKVTVG